MTYCVSIHICIQFSLHYTELNEKGSDIKDLLYIFLNNRNNLFRQHNKLTMYYRLQLTVGR